MAQKQYESIELSIGEEEGKLTPITELVSAIRATAAAGNYQEVVDQLLDLVDRTQKMGLARVALELLQDLREIVPESEWAGNTRGWILNAEGLALTKLGLVEEARKKFSQMLQVGQDREDQELILTAQQNLGIIALQTNDIDTATFYFKEGIEASYAAKDYHRALQLLLNMLSLEIETHQVNRAENTITDIERLVTLSKDPHLQLTINGLKGRLAVYRKDYIEAGKFFRSTLKYARQSGDLIAEVQALIHIGNVWIEQGKPRNALYWYQRAEKSAKSIDSPVLFIQVYRAIAGLLHQTKQLQEAIHYLELAYNLAGEIKDTTLLIQTAADLGAVLVDAGQIVQGSRLLESALDLTRYEKKQDREWKLQILKNLIAVSTKSTDRLDTDPRHIGDYVNRALNLLPSNNHKERSNLLQLAARAWLLQSGYRGYAAYYYERSLEEFRSDSTETERTANQQGLAWATVQAAAALRDAGALEDALQFFEEGLKLYQELGDEQAVFHTRNDRAIILTDLRRFNEARQEYDACLDLANRREDRAMALQVYQNTAEMTRREGNVEEAIRANRHALGLARDLGDISTEAFILANLGTALVDIQDYKQSRKNFRQARMMAHNNQEPETEGRSIAGLANIEYAETHYHKAAHLYHTAAELAKKIGDTHSYLTSMWAWMESLAAAGQDKEIESKGQELVNKALEIHDEEESSQAITRIAQQYLKRGIIEQAANFYAVAFVMAINAYAEESRASLSPVVTVVALMVTQTRAEIKYEPQKVYDVVRAELERMAPDSKDIFNQLLDSTAKWVISDRPAESQDVNNLGSAYTDLEVRRKQ